MLVNYGGSQISCSDSSYVSLVIFFRGCPYSCFYCHNKGLRSGENLVDIEEIKKQIKENFLISEVIFSGGECMLQPEAVRELAWFSKSLGLKVGIETSGYNSGELVVLLKEGLFDEVFLDVKTYGSEEYLKLTGNRSAWKQVLNTIFACTYLKIPLQVRTTYFLGGYPGENAMIEIRNMVNRENLVWKKQEGIL